MNQSNRLHKDAEKLVTLLGIKYFGVELTKCNLRGQILSSVRQDGSFVHTVLTKSAKNSVTHLTVTSNDTHTKKQRNSDLFCAVISDKWAES